MKSKKASKSFDGAVPPLPPGEDLQNALNELTRSANAEYLPLLGKIQATHRRMHFLVDQIFLSKFASNRKEYLRHDLIMKKSRQKQ